MLLTSWLRSLKFKTGQRKKTATKTRRSHSYRFQSNLTSCVELLEDRTLLSAKIIDLNPSDSRESRASGINDLGQVVGRLLDESDPTFGPSISFIWEKDTGILEIGSPPNIPQLPYTKGRYNFVADINNSGQVAGTGNFFVDSGYPDVGNHAYLWDSETKFRDLGTLRGLNSNSESRSMDINDAGQVVGYSDLIPNDYNNFRAFLWNPNTQKMQKIGPLAEKDASSFAIESAANGINNAGQVVGFSRVSKHTFDQHAFLWDPITNQIQDLQTLGGRDSRANDINNLGQVVGRSDTATEKNHLFLWDSQQGMQDLGSFGSSLLEINDFGQILGTGYLDGESFSFLITPIDEDGDGEPDTWFRDDDGDGRNDLTKNVNDLIDPESGWKE